MVAAAGVETIYLESKGLSPSSVKELDHQKLVIILPDGLSKPGAHDRK